MVQQRSNPDGMSLVEIAEHARAWLFDAADLWRARPNGETPFFPERMSVHGEMHESPHRLFVQARHIFSYCEIGRLGWRGPWREMVAADIDFLVENGRRADGFYIHRFDPRGAVLDARADLYDQAFMLLALAYAGRGLARPELFAAADELGDALERGWRMPHGGYFEGDIAICPPYRQNPHMHLLESFIALHKATGAPRWRRSAEHVAHLCARSFVHAGTGALLEYFDAELRPLDGEEGRVAEPGHCFEWAWLFEMMPEWDAADTAAISDRMSRFARRHGLCPHRGVVRNEVFTDGSVRNDAARLWPQTERLKAALARHRRIGGTDEQREAAAAYRGLVKYFDTPRRGAWRDKLGADGSWVDEPAPGSSLYHITCALAELIDTANSVPEVSRAIPARAKAGSKSRSALASD
jgi:mannose/cellobiose epimerase-like protein (N-acyl-D-glucosamine 2-epimerase family)